MKGWKEKEWIKIVRVQKWGRWGEGGVGGNNAEGGTVLREEGAGVIGTDQVSGTFCGESAWAGTYM